MASGRAIPANAFGLTIYSIAARPFKSRLLERLRLPILAAALGHRRSRPALTSRGARTRFAPFGGWGLPPPTRIRAVLLRYFDFSHQHSRRQNGNALSRGDRESESA